MKRNIILGVILIFIFFIIGFGLWSITGKTSSKIETGKPVVMTSFYPLYFFTSQIGGDKIQVKNVTPSSVEPHDYEPTARDLMDIQNSELLFTLGNGFEAWGSKVKDDLKDTGVKVVEVSEGIMSDSDPHIWLSPEVAKKMADVIATELVRMDEPNTTYYLENAKTLVSRLDKLSTDYKTHLTSCEESSIVTSHAAFGYLAKEYGLTQIAISGLSPDEEPSTKRLMEVALQAKGEKLKYIFFEKLVSPDLAETIASEIGAKTLVLDPIEGISDDDVVQGKDYFTLMDENLANLKIALSCQ